MDKKQLKEIFIDYLKFIKIGVFTFVFFVLLGLSLDKILIDNKKYKIVKEPRYEVTKDYEFEFDDQKCELRTIRNRLENDVHKFVICKGNK